MGGGPAERIDVDPAQRLGPASHALVGFGWNTGGLDGVAPLRPSTVRIDASLQDRSRGPGDLDLGPLLERVAAVRAIGAQPQVILSYMPAWLGEPHAAGRDPTRVAPSDYDAWEALVEEVVRGLATAGQPAYRFEVWNEPDLPVFWQDTVAAFLELAVRTHRAVARVAEETGLPLEIGGPAALFPNPAIITPYVTRMRAEGLPLDFVSWHYYGNYPFLGPDGAEATVPEPLLPAYPLVGREHPAASPRLYGAQVELVRGWVQAATAGSDLDPGLVIDEWNLSAGGLDRRHDSHVGAAFAAGVLVEMERAGLDAADFYRSGSDAPAGDWGVVAPDGARKPVWWVFWAWRQAVGERVALRGDDPDGGLWARATSDGAHVDVLLAAFDASGGTARSVEVAVAGACGTAETRRLDAAHASMAPAAGVPVEDGVVVVDLGPQSALWLRVALRCPAAADPIGQRSTPRRLPATGGGLALLAAGVAAAVSAAGIRPGRVEG